MTDTTASLELSWRACLNRQERPTGLAGLWFVVKQWHKRAQSRRELAQLDLRTLHDIGIDPFEALQESTKPFWRD